MIIKKSIIFLILTHIVLSCNSIHKKTINNPIDISNYDIVYGADSARITMFMFSNYNCAFCRKFYTEVFPEIERNFINTGKVKFVVKLIDFTKDDYVMNSMKAVVCVNQYGDMSYLHKLLLIQPEVIYTDEFTTLTDDLIAKDDAVAECILSGDAENYLTNNLLVFKKLKLTGTPTFIINSKIIKGYKDYAFFEKTFLKELRKTHR